MLEAKNYLLSSQMRAALRYVYTGRYLIWRDPDVPGGRPTVEALVRRGLLERMPDGHVALTDAGVEVASQ